MSPAQLLLLENIPGVAQPAVRRVVNYLAERKMNFPSARKGVVRLFEVVYNRYGTVPRPSLEAVTEAHLASERIMAQSEQNGIKMITCFDEEYPKMFRQMADQPLLIHHKGNLEALKRPAVAIVGTREPSSYTLQEAPELSAAFIKAGFTIVSGIASGCDTIAHAVAVAHHVPSVAVMAGGLHSIFPEENQGLAQEVLESGGLLLSEYACGTKPSRGTFIASNRLQTGLSQGVVVLETSLEGGTMEAARCAGRQGKPLACLYPPMPESAEAGYENKFSGNKKLAEQKKVVRLENKAAVDDYIQVLLQKLPVGHPAH